MKTYEPASLVELGNASDLVLGVKGEPPDHPEPIGLFEWATALDVD